MLQHLGGGIRFCSAAQRLGPAHLSGIIFRVIAGHLFIGRDRQLIAPQLIQQLGAQQHRIHMLRAQRRGNTSIHQHKIIGRFAVHHRRQSKEHLGDAVAGRAGNGKAQRLFGLQAGAHIVKRRVATGAKAVIQGRQSQPIFAQLRLNFDPRQGRAPRQSSQLPVIGGKQLLGTAVVAGRGQCQGFMIGRKGAQGFLLTDAIKNCNCLVYRSNAHLRPGL